MKVLVVGSTGFVGSNLNIEEQGIEFYGIDLDDRVERLNSKYFSFKKLDFLSHECLDYIHRLQPDYVVLLAGIQFTSPIQKKKVRKAAFHQNVMIARQATEVLQLTPSVRKLIYVSTDMVYGIQPKRLIDEQCVPSPIGEYGKSKLHAEEILASFDSRVVVLRPRLIVGPGRVGTLKLLARFVHGHLPIPLIGRGDNRYQMLSVFDLWSAMFKCLNTEISGVFNLGSNSPPTLNELFPLVFENLRLKKSIIRFPKKITEQVLLLFDKFNLSPLAPEQFLIAGVDCALSTEKFKSQTGWEPIYTDQEIITNALLELKEKDHT